MSRTTLTDVLFDICYEKWQQEGVILRKDLRPPVGCTDLATLLETDEGVICTMYPHDAAKHPPLEQTLLHEMLHFGLDLDGEWDRRCAGRVWKKEEAKRGATYWLERYLWRRLTQQQKGLLTELLEKGNGGGE